MTKFVPQLLQQLIKELQDADFHVILLRKRMKKSNTQNQNQLFIT